MKSVQVLFQLLEGWVLLKLRQSDCPRGESRDFGDVPGKKKRENDRYLVM